MKSTLFLLLATFLTLWLGFESRQLMGEELMAAELMAAANPLGGFSYSDFSSLDGLTLLGSAGQDGNNLALVSGLYQNAAVWYTTSQNVQDGFETTFQFQGNGPDGLAFVIQNDSLDALGVSGGNIGYGSIPNSLAIEFDTSFNPTADDPNGNHVSVQTRGVQENSSNHNYSLGAESSISPVISDDSIHTVQISYADNTMTIFLDDLNTPVLEVSVELDSILNLDNGQAWVGLTAGSGDLTGTYDLLNWSFSPVNSGSILPIAFESVRDGNHEIYLMNTDGSEQTNLTNDPAMDVDPSWSPDGTRIAFSSTRTGNAEIHVMNADGSGVTNLTNHGAWDFDPAWSPDGTRIAFVSTRHGDNNAEIYVMNADGSNQVRLTSNSAVDDREPAWSSDSTRIAFASNRDGNYEIYIMNANGSGQSNLTNNTSLDLYPAWSPDGIHIAFYSNRDGESEIYVMNSDGSEQTNLTNNPTAGDAEPAWSPNGAYLLFGSYRDGFGEIYLMNADGTGQTRLTNNDYDDWSPAWSPADEPMPTATPTHTPTAPPATATDTPTAPPATDTPTVPPPTATDTPTVPPATATDTPTVPPPTATDTPTVPPATATNTPTIPSATATDTPTVPPPTATDTPTVTPTVPSPTATDTPTVTPTVPPPNSIQLDASAGLDSINVGWSLSGSLSGNLDQYELLRSADGGLFTLLTNTTGSQYTDDDPNLTVGSEYCYQVNALDSSGNVISTSNTACVEFGALTLWVPHQVVQPDATNVPVTINLANGNGLCMRTMDITVSYDSTVVTASGTVSPTIYTTGYALNTNTLVPGEVKISSLTGIDQCQDLYGPGRLFDLFFNVVGNEGEVSPLNFITGLTGTVIYDSDDLFNPVDLVLENGSLTVDLAFVRGDMNGDGVVNTVDAALAQDIANGLITPTPQQLAACDINGDAVCNSADASLIHCYANSQDWTLCPETNDLLDRRPSGMVDLAIGTPVHEGQSVIFPVEITNASDFAGGDFVLTYDPTLMSATGASLSDLSAAHDFQIATNLNEAGILRISLASYERINADGTILELEFTSMTGGTSSLDFGSVRLNDATGRDFETSALQRQIQLIPHEGEPGPTSTPTPTATPTASSSQTATPAPPSSATPTTTPTASSSQTPVPSSTETPTSTPTVSESGQYKLYLPAIRRSNAVIRGDINGDGMVNTTDSFLALQIASGAFKPTPQQLAACDVNGDGECDTADSSLILCYASYQDWTQCVVVPKPPIEIGVLIQPAKQAKTTKFSLLFIAAPYAYMGLTPQKPL